MLFLWTSLFAIIFAAVTATVTELIFSNEPFLEKRTFGYIFLFVFATTYIRMYMSDSSYLSFFTFIFFAILFFISKYGYKKDGKSFAIRIAIIILLSTIGDIVALFANYYLFGFDKVYHWTEPMFLPPAIVSNLSQLVLAYVLNIIMSRRKKNKNLEENSLMQEESQQDPTRQEEYTQSDMPLVQVPTQNDMQKSYMIIAVLLVLEIALFGWMVFSSRRGNIYIMTFYPSLGVLFMMSFLLLYLLLDAATVEKDRSMRKMLYSLEKHDKKAFELYKQMEQEYLRLHRIRHDINNQLYTAAILAKNNEQEKADKLFTEIENSIGSIEIFQKEE